MKKNISQGKFYFNFLNNCREYVEKGNIQLFKYNNIVTFLEFQSFSHRHIPTKIQIGSKIVQFYVKPDFSLGWYDYTNF